MDLNKLKQEAEESAKKFFGKPTDLVDLDNLRIFKNGYLAGAEPREKEIKSLGKRCLQLQKDKGNLTDRVRELEQQIEQAKKDKVVEHFESYGQCRDSRRIAELEAQIEKMKCLNEEIIKALNECLDYEWLHAHNGKAKYLYLQTVIDIVNEKFKEIKEK